MAPIHDRMPLILRPDDWLPWLAPDADLDRIKPLIDAAASKTMVAYQVSRSVSNAREEGPGLIEPVEGSDGGRPLKS